MRLRRLDLTRYGKFTNQSLDFGPRPEGLPDLHIVYGPNEAGKSTAFAAFLDLLFGIGTQSPFDFLHPYSTMRIGGLLEFGNEASAFTRIKRPQNSLLDASDRPISESAIRGELGGIDREAYRTMFSLDDETLERGGDGILASKGDLGELLFSASAGLADLSRKLVDLKGEADRFYKFRARSGQLADLKAHLAALKTEREQFDTLASEYARLIDVRDRAATQYDQSIAERTRIQARMDEIQRHLGALPRLSVLRGLRERLVPFAELPEAPPAWPVELPELQREEIELGVQTQLIADEIERLVSEVDAIVVDETALPLSERAERLADLRARYVTAEKDIPERRLQLREADLAIAGILGRIEQEGEPEPRRLLLNAATIGALRELIESRSGIDAAMRVAAAELAEARRRLAEAIAMLREFGEDPDASHAPARSMPGLAATVAALRSTDHRVRQRLVERAYEAAREILADRLRALHPWQGEAGELIGMRCPSQETLQRWKLERSQCQATLAQHLADVERLTTEIQRLEAERGGLEAMTGIVTDQEAALIRASREQAWATLRRDLDATSADMFEVALRHDDIVSAGRFSHMSELAKLHQSGQALIVAEADLKRAVELSEAAATTLQALDEQVADAIRVTAPSLVAPLSLSEFEDWLARRDKALEAREAALIAERDLRAAQSDAREAVDRLKAALEEAGATSEAEAGFDTLLAQAQEKVDREAEVRRLRTTLNERQRDVKLRQDQAEQAGADDQAWTAGWTSACAECWLSERTEIPPLGVVREILVALNELGPAIERKAGLNDRIEKMERDQVAFGDEVVALADTLEVATGSTAVLDLAQRIGEKVRGAAADVARRGKAVDKLEEARQRQRSLAETSAIHVQRKAVMTSFFGVTSLSDVAGKLSDLTLRSDLRARAEDTEREILDATRSDDLAEAERILDTVDRPGLEAELIELRARFDDQDQRCHELFAVRSTAMDQVEAIGGDARVAEIEERRRTTLLEIEDGALRYLQLRAGTVATEQALVIYRERHRSSMMARASQAFRTISRGAYTGLAAQPAKDGETLIALSAGGGSKAADELSKGTRFQLYLALRVAGYHEFVRARTCVPFVADDIMETFDDFRAEEAFRLFAEMAGVGQVIYLTHHQHLCDIALKVCPSAQIHRLEQMAIA